MPIDHNYIRATLERFEGRGIARGYVPTKKGTPLGVSGVTIGTGVDLGQQTALGLLDMGVPFELVDKLRPYIGYKRQDAQRVLGERPLILSAAEVRALDDAVICRYVREIAARYDKDKPTTPFRAIPPEAQAVVVSILYQRGLASPKKFPNTWRLLLAGDWRAAADKFCNAALWDGYQSRRAAEGQILRGIKLAETLPGPGDADPKKVK